MLTFAAVFGLILFIAVAALGFGLAPDRDPDVVEAARPSEERSRFFVLKTDASAVPQGEVPVELLLSRLEQHVRQERAAVESFCEQPSPEKLRVNTSSPLAN